jgi:phage shock protein A
MTLCEKVKVMCGTLVNKLTNCFTSPLERLEYLQEQKEDELREVLQNVTDLTGNIKELEAGQIKTKQAIINATEAAERGVKDNVPDAQILKIIARKNNLQQSYDENAKYLEDTQAKLVTLKAQVKEYEASIDEIKLQITQLNTESKISGVKVKIAHTTAGLDSNNYQINKNLQQGKAQVARENAQADAILELQQEGFYEPLNGATDGDIVDKTLSDSKAKDELAALKTKLGKVEK